MGVVELKPNDKLHMLLDAYHSDFREVQTIQRMEYGTIWSGATLTTVSPIRFANGRLSRFGIGCSRMGCWAMILRHMIGDQ